MRLTPKEQEKLMLHMAGNLAKERKERGVKLNYVESLAYISSELLELARDGKTVVELMQLGTKILTKKDVPVGFIEAKDIGDSDLDGLKKTGNKEQFDRYKDSLSNLIFTDYLNFHIYRDGEFLLKISIDFELHECAIIVA